MELYQLRAFVAVARQGNFTRAAEELHLSQPTISGQIKSLEEDNRRASLQVEGIMAFATALELKSAVVDQARKELADERAEIERLQGELLRVANERRIERDRLNDLERELAAAVGQVEKYRTELSRANASLRDVSGPG
jgi:uncharacterized protein YlxW (UPF0749 family)